jgi:hypothetical protein
MKKLHKRWGDRVQFIEVMVRQAHPGPHALFYASFKQKMKDAQAYQNEYDIPWPVLVDDLEGSVHKRYGALPDPSYLIGSDGRAAFCNLWTHAPTLHEKIRRLLRQGGNGVVDDGLDRMPHPVASVVGGWPALRRGLLQSYIDLETSLPGSATLLLMGQYARPLLGPMAFRSRPIPKAVKFGAAAALVGAVILAGRAIAGGRREELAAPPWVEERVA